MQPVTIEFNVKQGDTTFKEDSVTFESAEALFEYVAPGGGCEHMPSDLGEIQMSFRSPSHGDTLSPLADKRVTLQLGLVFLNGPLATIVQISQELIDRMERNELSDAFQTVIGIKI